MRHREQKATEAATDVATPVAVNVPGVELGQAVREVPRVKEESELSVKITIAKEAAFALKEFVVRVNEGFDAGQVHRQDIASWIILRFVASCSEQDVHELRMSHYDDISMLDSLFRRAKESGEVPEFLREALKKHFTGSDSNRKTKKPIGKGYMSDVLQRNGDDE